jgi:hypothetical protein
MVTIVHGIERQIGSARSAQRNKPVIIALSPAERAFLLYRLADRAASIETVLYAQRTGQTVSPWDREMVRDHLHRLIDALRRDKDLIVITELDKLLVAQAIAHNPYFAQMHASDPRLTIDGLKRADVLRRRLIALLDRPIGKVPLGAGRTRIKDGGHHERPVADHRVQPPV